MTTCLYSLKLSRNVARSPLNSRWLALLERGRRFSSLLIPGSISALLSSFVPSCSHLQVCRSTETIMGAGCTTFVLQVEAIWLCAILKWQSSGITTRSNTCTCLYLFQPVFIAAWPLVYMDHSTEYNGMDLYTDTL